MIRPRHPALRLLRTKACSIGRRGERLFPWRRQPSWYRVLLAEILLQHTPVARVEPVFNRITQRWSKFGSLKQANGTELLAALKPLGLQRRRAAALKVIASRSGPRRPKAFGEVTTLPGVGPYTAGIAWAVCANSPKPFVDGGIARLLCRYFGIRSSIKRSAVDRSLWQLSELIGRGCHARYLAWGLVDIARTICRPRPICSECPLRGACRYQSRLSEAR